jgi:hypothetical protein
MAQEMPPVVPPEDFARALRARMDQLESEDDTIRALLFFMMRH